MKYGTLVRNRTALLVALVAPLGLAAQETDPGRPLAVPVFKTLVNFDSSHKLETSIRFLETVIDKQQRQGQKEGI